MIGSDYLELPATWDRGQRSRWVRTGQISTLPRPCRYRTLLVEACFCVYEDLERRTAQPLTFRDRALQLDPHMRRDVVAWRLYPFARSDGP
jgi:hypothetical protein